MKAFIEFSTDAGKDFLVSADSISTIYPDPHNDGYVIIEQKIYPVVTLLVSVLPKIMSQFLIKFVQQARK